MSCHNLERSHLATAAELHWGANERHMDEHAGAVHVLPACELNTVLVAVSGLSGAQGWFVWLTMDEHWTCLKECNGCPHQPLGVFGVSLPGRARFTSRWPSIGCDASDARRLSLPPGNALTLVIPAELWPIEVSSSGCGVLKGPWKNAPLVFKPIFVKELRTLRAT